MNEEARDDLRTGAPRGEIGRKAHGSIHTVRRSRKTRLTHSSPIEPSGFRNSGNCVGRPVRDEIGIDQAGYDYLMRRIRKTLGRKFPGGFRS